jgi:hypothetical protein
MRGSRVVDAHHGGTDIVGDPGNDARIRVERRFGVADGFDVVQYCIHHHRERLK